MLIGSSTKYGAGFTLAGDTNDLVDLYETINYVASENGPISHSHSEFVLGFAYDVRHAHQGDRRIVMIGNPDYAAKYHEFDSLWIVFLVQLAMIRAAVAYTTTEKSHQANLYRVESCVQSALESVDTNSANECMLWLASFSLPNEDFLIDFVTEVSRNHVLSGATQKQRIRSLPKFLQHISPYSPEYKIYQDEIMAIALKNNCRPQDLWDHSTWPEFKW